jgi:hypothetical protein
VEHSESIKKDIEERRSLVKDSEDVKGSIHSLDTQIACEANEGSSKRNQGKDQEQFIEKKYQTQNEKYSEQSQVKLRFRSCNDIRLFLVVLTTTRPV